MWLPETSEGVEPVAGKISKTINITEGRKRNQQYITQKRMKSTKIVNTIIEDDQLLMDYDIKSDAISQKKGMAQALKLCYIENLLSKVDWIKVEPLNNKLKQFFELDEINIFTKSQLKKLFFKKFKNIIKKKKRMCNLN
ncbi:uncharacterized protein LOC126844799 [Adelges cooleyi]|uniref:uncharacterized protein LOC126844799 n=1 Tax=Adelges cooleyi TaxID=133065 RepID=UPI0021801234|nr:uncharacterized protein LOC126844799 [Adelges cooleyi]